MNPTVYSQLPGDAGVFQTVQMMRGLVNANFLHPWIRERAALVTQNCDRDPLCEDRMLLAHVINAIQYVRDPSGVEALSDPVRFVEERLRNRYKPFGDCDDMSIYLATLLKSIGHKPRFRVVSRLDSKSFHHILVFCHGKNLDPTMEYGQEPRNPTRAVQIEV